MQVETYLFGTITVDPSQILTFPDGLVGFENQRSFTLVHEEGKTAPVSFTLQSLDEPSLAFQIIDPSAIGFNYQLSLTDEETTKLQNPTPEDTSVMLILFARKDGGNRELGAGLRSPLIINAKSRVGIQKVIEQRESNITISNLSNAV